MKDKLEKTDFTDMSRPPTGHHENEGAGALQAKVDGPGHMREELNPTVNGQDQLNRGQERRQGERRRGWRSEPVEGFVDDRRARSHS